MADETLPRSDTGLHGLRIDAAARQPQARSKFWMVGLVLVLASIIGGTSLWLYETTLGRPPLVQVAFAQLVGSGASAAGSVLSGAGYIVTGDRYISIGVRVPGRIDAYEVEEGDFVRKGAVLVRLDNRDYRARVRRAEASLELAKANLVLKRKQAKRMRELHARGLIAEHDLDVAENEFAVTQATISQREADVTLAQVELEYATLKAPTDGIVLQKLKEVGMIAVPGGFDGSGDLIRIANLNDLRGEVDINEVDFRGVHLGQQAEVAPDAYPERTYPAQVVKVYPQANRQRGTIKVEVKLENSDAYLRPDMSVRINFLADVPPAGAVPRVLVPQTALRRNGTQTFVWTVREEQLRRIPVQVGDDFGDTVQVTNGLDGGEALLMAGPDNLHEGMRVQTID